jgi:hypothetical protein
MRTYSQLDLYKIANGIEEGCNANNPIFLLAIFLPVINIAKGSLCQKI